MQHFHSNKSFNQYKPHQSFWQKLKSKKQKNRLIVPIANNKLDLKNPFKKEPAPKKNRNRIVVSLFLLLFIGWIVLILSIPYFNISRITISGNKITKIAEIDNFVRQNHFSRKNYFLFPDKKVAENLKNTFLYEDVKIKKVFPDTIEITVNEKPASVIYDNNINFYLLDADSKIIKPLTEFAHQFDTSTSTITTTSPNLNVKTYQEIASIYGDFPVILNQKPISENLQNFLPIKTIEAANKWNKLLNEQSIGKTKYFEIGDTYFNLKIYLNQSWYILVNTELDQNIQLRNLKIILENNKPIEYIDLRFGERVYWK